MDKYKIVNVYSGYNENSINGVKVVEDDRNDISLVCIDILKKKKEKVKDDNMDYFEEFVNGWSVNWDEVVGFVNDGEEGFDLVIMEDSYWWYLVDKENGYKWDKKICDKWDNWLNKVSNDISVEGKI
jgi:hypothetical protein